MHKKLIFIPIGGLGNQLFGYAAAKRLATVNDAQLLIDSHSGFIKDQLYNRSYQLHHFKIREKLLSQWDIRVKLGKFSQKLIMASEQFIRPQYSHFIRQKNSEVFAPELLEHKIKYCTWMQGYWQSERYFSDIADIIERDLEIVGPVDTRNIKYQQLIYKTNSVAIHMRFFDYHKTDKTVNNVAMKYYQDAIGLVKSKISKPHFFIFSDRPDLISLTVDLQPDEFTIIDHNSEPGQEYADFWLMSECKHFIIANSTFSWWAAWLGEKKRFGAVISPNFKTQSTNNGWGFKYLIPDRWTIL